MNSMFRGTARYRLWVRICAALAAGWGLTALLGWILHIPLLAGFMYGRIPMAPSTAMMFLLLGGAAFARADQPSRQTTVRAGWIIGSLGVMVAFALLVLSLRGIHLDIEHAGFTVNDIPGAPPIGHMSPVTAFCFLIGALSFLASLPSAPDRTRTTTIPAAWLAGFLIVAGLTLVLAYLYGAPLFYKGSFIPPAATTSLAFVAWGIALLGLAEPRASLFARTDEYAGRPVNVFILIFVVLASGIVFAGHLYHRRVAQQHRARVEQELLAVANLKVEHLVEWRKGYLDTAALFHRNGDFHDRVQQLFKNSESPENRRRLDAWLSPLRETYGCDRVSLMDADGVEWMSFPADEEPRCSALKEQARKVMLSGLVAFMDFHRDAIGQAVHLGILVPVMGKEKDARAIGLLVMRIDPSRRLYPYISRWPTPSRTAETLIVRRDGDDVVFLTDLRFQTNAALNLRIPVANSDLPAAMAVSGRDGIVEGVDYRGVPVLAGLRAVPDSPWFLIARMDISEAYGPLTRRLWLLVGVVVSLLIAAGIIVALFIRQQSVAFYRERYDVAQALHMQAERYRRTLDDMMEGCQIIDRNWRYLYLNEAAAAHGRRPISKLIGHTMMEFYPGIESTAMFAALRRCMDERTPCRMENEFVYPDGSRAWFDLSIQPVPEGVFILSLDITQRKQSESERKRAEEDRKHLEAQLLQAQKLESIGTLAGGVAHEINNPINGIMNYAQLILDKLGPDHEVSEFATEIRKETERVAVIVKNLLCFARHEKQTYSPARLCDIVEGAISLIRAVLRHDQIALELHVPEDLPKLKCRSQQIQQVIMNLVTNARDALNEKYPAYHANKKIIVKAECGRRNAEGFERGTEKAEDEREATASDSAVPSSEFRVPSSAGAWIRLTVEDHGVGISNEVRQRMFDPFYTTKPRDKGTGLGLSISHGIVKEHGGELGVESEQGGWTRIHVYLPTDNEWGLERNGA